MILRFVELLKNQMLSKIGAEKGDSLGMGACCFFLVKRCELLHFGVMKRILDS